MIYAVYALVDPLNDELFYIGITSNQSARKSSHNVMSKYKRTPHDLRIQSIIESERRPIMKLIEETPTRADAEEREYFWISCYQSAGYQLTNEVKLAHRFTGDALDTIAKFPPVPMMPNATSRQILRFLDTHYIEINDGAQVKLLKEHDIIFKARRGWALTGLGKRTLARMWY